MSTATASEELLQLPEDILMQILSRLPTKSLLRFRSVCKSWRDLIQDPRFVGLHHSCAKICTSNSPVLVLRSIEGANRDQPYSVGSKVISFLSDQTSTLLGDMDIDVSSTLSSSPDMLGIRLDGEVQVHGPCNGVICLSNSYDIVLCNPAIREFKAVPLPPFTYPRDLQSMTVGVGFGFDPVSNDYKIIKISQLFEDDDGYSNYAFDSFRVEIYNLSIDSWRHIDIDVPIDVGHFPCFEIFFNGAFHFYGSDDDETESILSFDLSKEEFRTIDFPSVCSYPDGKYRSLSVQNDSLALILYNPSEAEKCFDIWVMRDYGVEESWNQVYSIGPLAGIDWPLTLWKDSQLLLESSSGQLVSCNLDTQEIREFEVYGFRSSLRALPFKESLMSIKRSSSHLQDD